MKSAAWPCPTPTQSVARRHDESRSAHPEWMSERNRPTVDVDLLVVETKLANDDEALRGERFVELDEVEVPDADTGPVEQLAHGRNGTDAHHARVDSRHGAADERPERLGAKLLRLPLARDHQGGCTVVDATRVAGRHAPALAERGRERRQLLGARVGTRMLVTRNAVDGNELVVEASGLRRGGPA